MSTVPHATPTLEEAQRAYARSLYLGGKSPRTCENYLAGLRRFRAYLDTLDLPPGPSAGDLPPNCVEDFCLFLHASGVKASSTRTYLYGVRSFLRYLLRRDLLDPGHHARLLCGVREALGSRPHPHRPVDLAVARLVTAALAAPLPRERQARLIALRDRAIIAVLYATGLRRAELCSLDRAHVDGGAAFVVGKGQRGRTVYFDRCALEAVGAYLEARSDGHPALFIRHDDGSGGQSGRRDVRLSGHYVWLVVRSLGRRLGLTTHPHQLRHLKAQVLLNNGAQLAEVQDILGHEDISVTKRYYAQHTQAHIAGAWQRYSQSAASLVEGTPPRTQTGGAAGGPDRV